MGRCRCAVRRASELRWHAHTTAAVAPAGHRQTGAQQNGLHILPDAWNLSRHGCRATAANPRPATLGSEGARPKCKSAEVFLGPANPTENCLAGGLRRHLKRRPYECNLAPKSDFDFSGRSYGLHSVFYYMPENLFGVGAVPEFAEKCPQVPKSAQNDIHASRHFIILIQKRYFPS